jgi:hypothetical protein
MTFKSSVSRRRGGPIYIAARILSAISIHDQVAQGEDAAVSIHISGVFVTYNISFI